MVISRQFLSTAIYCCALLAGWQIGLCAERSPATEDAQPTPIPASDANQQRTPGNETAQPAFGEDDLVALALENNPTIQQTLAEIEKLRGLELQVGLKPNPTLAYSGDEIGNDGAAGLHELNVSQTFVTADKLAWNRTIANEELSAAIWDWKSQEMRVTGGLRFRYYEYLAAKQRTRLAEELHKLTESVQKTSQDLLAAGEVSQSQVLQANIETRKAWLRVQQARQEQQACRRRLSAFIGLADTLQGEITGDFFRLPDDVDWEQTWEQLRESSPVVQAAKTRVQRARYAIHRAEAQAVPDLQTSMGVGHDAGSGDTYAGVGVGISLPIFDRNQGTIQSREAELIRLCHEVHRSELSLQEEFAQVLQRYQTARQRVDEFQQRMIPWARESLQLAMKNYQHGQQSFLQLLTVQRTYFEVKNDYLADQLTLWKSLAAIESCLLTDGLEMPNATDIEIP